MPEIRFYHLQRSAPLMAIAPLLDKALKQGKRVVVRTADQTAAEKLANDLWTVDPDAFLPHGTKADGHADRQPVWITPGSDNPNGAGVLILLANAPQQNLDAYDLVCDLFDGRNENETAAARARYAGHRAAGSALTYWRQNQDGKWEVQNS